MSHKLISKKKLSYKIHQKDVRHPHHRKKIFKSIFLHNSNFFVSLSLFERESLKKWIEFQIPQQSLTDKQNLPSSSKKEDKNAPFSSFYSLLD
jgi:hypothetical protein